MKSLFLVSLALVALAGCQGDDSGRTPDQEKMASNVHDWAKASGGDWNKLTKEQQDAMVKSVGSEGSAKKVLEFSAHPPTPITPGPPAGWKPGGPPPSQGP
ncbi:hypothetical protein BH11ARM2_BH11ARM2_22750 [soil metagenome]